MKFKPEETAYWADWPVNHADLCAAKAFLIRGEANLTANLIADIEWCDPKMAGRWIWAASSWIGSGLTRPNAIPKITGTTGVNCATGVSMQRPQITLSAGVNCATGVSMQIPRLIDVSGVGTAEVTESSGLRCDAIYDWFDRLSARLRNVKVVCGEWDRVCGGEWQADKGTVGIFFDPPYAVENRSDCYAKDSRTVAKDVMAWALERGKDKAYRIVLAGYDEHEALLSHGWKFIPWKATGGYSVGRNNNSERERLYYSPGCIQTGNAKQMILF
jgi:hypothetical protein